MEILYVITLVVAFQCIGHGFGTTNDNERHSEKDFLRLLPHVGTHAEFGMSIAPAPKSLAPM